MGFLVTKFYPRRVVKAACSVKEKSKILKKSYKKYFHRKYASYTGKYLMFLDIETDGILGDMGTSDFIPNIKQLACILYKTKDFFENPSVDKFTCYECKNLNSHSGYIINFLKLYTYYDNPCLIAHNGCGFDFKIIIAHIKRYIPKDLLYLKEICNTLRFFDTYVAIQVLLRRQNPQKWSKQSLKNTSLFMKYCINYTQHSYLVDLTHQALPDCKMTLLWVHALRHHLNWKQYNGYMDI